MSQPFNFYKLNIGCGRDIRPGWQNIDQFAGPGVDYVVDLNKGWLPFQDNSVSDVYASHVFEHLHDWEKLMIELWRVMIPGAALEIRVPYMDFSTYHVRQFWERSMWAFTFADSYTLEEHKSLEPCNMFNQDALIINRRRWYNYHFKKYLHKDWAIPGKKVELVWHLTKKVGR